jgi:PDZ domain-containing secreted protein
MKRSTLVLALAGLALFPVLAGAQEREQRQERENRVRGERLPYKTQVFTYSNRARLGVTVTNRRNEETDKYGARIQSVIEDGPADKAGLKEGDIITRFNGTSLAQTNDADEDHSPGQRLVELASELDEGDTVRVEYRRDGQTRNATIIAEEVETPFSMNFKMPDFQMMPRWDGPDAPRFEFEPGGPGGLSFFLDRGAGGLDLVELNGDLGEYFGTSEGLLVTKTRGDSASVLRAGDVILSIDGRKPTSVSQARRILGSYEEGETAKLEIMRKRQRMTVDWTVDRPELKGRELRPSRREGTHRM